MMLRHEVCYSVVIAPTGELVGVLSMREAFGLLLQAARDHQRARDAPEGRSRRAW